jgi:hypothetical protein
VVAGRGGPLAVALVGSLVLSAGAGVSFALPAVKIPHARRATADSRTAIADAINLRGSDLPGFTRGDGSTINERLVQQIQKCVSPTSQRSASASSPLFVASTNSSFVALFSTVSFVTPSVVRADANAAKRPAMPGCLVAGLSSTPLTISLGTQHVTAKASKVKAVSLPLPVKVNGTVPIVSIRVSATFAVHGESAPVSFDLDEVGVGSDELRLLVETLGHTYAAASEKHLVSVLVTRALAEPH